LYGNVWNTVLSNGARKSNDNSVDWPKVFFTFFFLYSSKNRSSQRDCSVTHTHIHTQRRNESYREERERKTFPCDDTAMKRRIWFLLHLFFSSSGGFAFRHLTRSLRKGIRSICGFPSFVYAYVCVYVCVRMCVWSFPRRCFMNTWIYLTDICPKDVFPMTNFPVRERSTRPPSTATSNLVFFAFYPLGKYALRLLYLIMVISKRNLFFSPLRLRMYTCSGRARQGYVHRNHFYHNHRKATFFCNIY